MTVVLQEQQLASATRSGADDEILQLYKEASDMALRSWSPFLAEASRDLEVYLGDQWDSQEKQYLESEKRNALVFNRVRRNVKMVTGFERRSRHSLIAQPIENADELTAEQLTKVMLWLANRENFDHIISDAFEGAVKTGINLLQLAVDYTHDPVNGDIKLDRIPHNAFLLDPRFTKRDLSDCEYVIQRRLLSRDAIKALLPFRADDIDRLKAEGSDSRFPHLDAKFQNRAKQQLRYDEFWLRKFKKVKVLIDRNTGETRQIDPKEFKKEQLDAFLEAFPSIQVVNKQIPTVQLNVIVENELMFSGIDPYNMGDFPHVPVMAFWDPEYSDDRTAFSDTSSLHDRTDNFFNLNSRSDFSLKLQSLVRCIRDPQTEANKRRSKMLDLLDSQINSGWIAKSDSVVNPKSLYQAGQGQVVWMKDDSQSGDVQKIPPADIPNGLFGIQQQMDKDIVEIAGISDELLGTAEDASGQISGVLSQLRQGASLTVLQDLFDNHRLSQKLLGKKLIKAVQGNWNPTKIARIINEQPSPQFFDMSAAVFDISVEEAIVTPSQRALAYTQMMQARQAGIPIPDDIIIDYMPIQEKRVIKERLEQDAQRAQQLEQERLEDQARLRELQRAKVFNDIGLGVERLARAEADRGLAAERESEFAENHAQAALARAKAMRELEEMDTNNLIKLVSFIREQEAQDRIVGQEVNRRRRQETEDEFGNLVAALQLPGVPGLLGTADAAPQNL